MYTYTFGCVRTLLQAIYVQVEYLSACKAISVRYFVYTHLVLVDLQRKLSRVYLYSYLWFSKINRKIL